MEPDILVRMSIAEYLRDCGYKVIEGVTADDVFGRAGVRTKDRRYFCRDSAERDTRRARSASRPLGGRPRSMDGFGLAQWVRENHPGIDVILTSGMARTAEKAGDLCDDGPLEKPYHPQEVVRRINLLLERRRTALKA